MKEGAGYVTGRPALLRYLARQEPDPRHLDPAAFGAWLRAAAERQASYDPLFTARCRVRDLVRAHRGELAPVVAAHAEAQQALAGSPAAARLELLANEARGAESAIGGLDRARSQAEHERQAALAAKRDGFRARLAALAEERAALETAPEVVRAAAAARALAAEEERVGIAAARAAVEAALAAGGQQTTRAGRSFEHAARPIVAAHVLRAVTRNSADVHVLANVTLGVARAELDFLVVRGGGERPVEVLALVEAKANPGDLGHGFALRQEALAFFTGDPAGYDPQQYRTRTYPRGVFDVSTEHREGSAAFRFDETSFRRFHRAEGGWFLDRLFFVTRARPLRGLPAALLGRLLYRVATDPGLDLHDPGALGALQRWVVSEGPALGAADVLRLYTASPRLGRRVVFAR